MAGAPSDAPFDPAWIDALVERVVVSSDSLEFHLNTGEVLATPWKNTAKHDLWAHRRKLAKLRQQEIDNSEVRP